MATARIVNYGNVTLPDTCPHISSFAKLNLPVTTGLVGAYVLGGDESLSLENRVDATRPLLKVGSPTFDPLFGATVQHANCFDTLLPTTASRTWIVVYKPQALSGAGAANRAPLLGNHQYVGPNLRGDQMWMGDPSAIYNQADRNNTTSASLAQNIGSLDTSKWAVAAGIVDGAGGFLELARRQLGVRTWASPVPTFTGRATYADRTVRIGGDGTGAPGIYSHDAKIGMVLMYEAALSRTEADLVLDYVSADWLKRYYGITDI